MCLLQARALRGPSGPCLEVCAALAYMLFEQACGCHVQTRKVAQQSVLQHRGQLQEEKLQNNRRSSRARTLTMEDQAVWKTFRRSGRPTVLRSRSCKDAWPSSSAIVTAFQAEVLAAHRASDHKRALLLYLQGQ